MFTCVLQRYAASIVLVLKRQAIFFTEGADSDTYWDDLGRQMRGDKKCPLNGVQPIMAEFRRRVPESEARGSHAIADRHYAVKDRHL